jgi:hypothetical protein
MLDYTRATYLLLKAQQQANITSRNNLSEQQQANERNQQNFREQQKPSLHIARIYANFFDEKNIYHITYLIKNIGKSPARNISLMTHTVFENTVMKSEPLPFVPLILPEAEIPSGHEFTSEQSAVVLKGGTKVSVVIELAYTDSENTEHYTRARMVISDQGKYILPYTEEIWTNPLKFPLPKRWGRFF